MTDEKQTSACAAWSDETGAALAARTHERIDLAQPFTWRAHPARERPLTAIMAGVCVFALALSVYAFSGTTAWAVVSAVVLCLSLSRFFFATHYEADADAITMRASFGRRRLVWSEIRRAEFGPRGAWLSPLGRRSWREARRGIHVLFGARREEVLAQLRARLPRDCLPSSAAQ